MTLCKEPVDAQFPGGEANATKLGGFYLALSDALPLDREIQDHR